MASYASGELEAGTPEKLQLGLTKLKNSLRLETALSGDIADNEAFEDYLAEYGCSLGALSTKDGKVHYLNFDGD